MEEIRLYEAELEPIELILTDIRTIVFGYFGIKPKKITRIDEQLEKLSERKTTKTGFSGMTKLRKGEIQAYEKAGMPSPFKKWLRKHRKDAKNGHRRNK